MLVFSGNCYEVGVGLKWYERERNNGNEGTQSVRKWSTDLHAYKSMRMHHSVATKTHKITDNKTNIKKQNTKPFISYQVPTMSITVN